MQWILDSANRSEQMQKDDLQMLYSSESFYNTGVEAMKGRK